MLLTHRRNFSGTGDVDEATARALFLLRMELAAKRPFPQLPGTIAWRTQDRANEHVPRSQDLSALTVGKKLVRGNETPRDTNPPQFDVSAFLAALTRCHACMAWKAATPATEATCEFSCIMGSNNLQIAFQFRRCRLSLLFWEA